MARYSELLYTEHVNGAGAMEEQLQDTYVEALTVDQPPLIQSARLEDYSPEFWAATAGKGAAVLNMLRCYHGRREFLQVAEGDSGALRREIDQHRRFPARWPKKFPARA